VHLWSGMTIASTNSTGIFLVTVKFDGRWRLFKNSKA
jgi:hypothetical protein